MSKHLTNEPHVTWRAIQNIADCSQGTHLKRYQVTSTKGVLLKVVQTGNLEHLYVSDPDPEQELYLDPEKIKRYQLEQGDVLVASRAGQMLASVVGEALISSVPTQNVYVLRPNLDYVDAVFLAGLLRSPVGQKLKEKFHKGSTPVASIRLSDLREIEVPIPPLETQAKLRELFTTVDQVVQHALEVMTQRQALADDILIATLELNRDED